MVGTDPGFAAIPPLLRRRLEDQARREAFDLLHREAVAAGELPPPPPAWSERAPGAVLRGLLYLGVGGAIGVLATLAVLFVLTRMPVLAP
ncbi:MAG: hypothetical protein D6702_00730 [Planctomycetota bacterium]|nr:MAG: hypothetical protein D6702_00730 [Planctomycetota bacterium]